MRAIHISNKMSYGKNLISTFSVLALLVVTLSGCGLNSGSGSNQGALQIRLVDAPTHYEAVLVNIQDVEVQDPNNSQSWITLNNQSKKINLLKLTNGTYTVLGDSTINPGKYPKLRIMFGSTGNQVIINGNTYNLSLSSNVQSGLVLDSVMTVDAGYRTIELLDVDLTKSIKKTGTNQYVFDPVIHEIDYSYTGAVKGTILPVKAHPVIFGIRGSDTLAATIADSTTGDFILLGLPGSSNPYNIAILPTDTTFNDTTITGVKLNQQNITDLQTNALSQK